MANFDESELIRSSEFQENHDQATRKFLRREYARLVETTEEQSEKCDSMEAMLVEMKNTLSQLCNQLGIHPIEAESSNQTPPVTFSDSYVCDDQNWLPMDNRKSLLRKIEMPKFDGYNAYDWLSEVERFFSVRRYSDWDKLDLVAFSLEGDVLLWFDREMTRREFQSWDEFMRRLLLQFGAAPESSSENVAEILEERASHTEKKGTVSASVTESAELSSQVIGLDESHLEQLFSNGLQTEMKVVLKLKESMGLEYQKKSRCLKASMFNFKQKKKRIKRWFNTLSCRESWRKPKHERLLCNLCHLRAPRGLGQLVLADLRSHMRHKWKFKHLRAVVGLQNNPSYALDVVTKPVTECKTTAAIFRRVLERSVSHDCFLGPLGSLWERTNVSWLGVVCVLAECLFVGCSSAEQVFHGLFLRQQNSSSIWHRWRRKGALKEETTRVKQRTDTHEYMSVHGSTTAQVPVFAFSHLSARALQRVQSSDSQLSVMHRIHQKLVAKFFDPFLVIELIGMVASKLEDFVSLYPISKLEDKLVFEGASIDTTQEAYYRKKKKNLAVKA